MMAVMRRAIALVVIAVALGLVPAAAAKGPISVTTCGAFGCKSTVLRPPWQGHLVIPAYDTRGGQSQPPPHAAPWFDLRFRLSDNWRRVDDRCQIPRPRLPLCYSKRRVFALADGSYAGGRDLPRRIIFWQRLSPGEGRFYARLTRGVEPLPAETLPGFAPTETDDGGQANWWPWVVGAVVLIGAGAAAAQWRTRRRAAAEPVSRRT
jgi:hypothetical protein